MQALILAGGLGTRLRSVVNDRPKPLAPVAGTPFLEHQLQYLIGNGIRQFVFCVGYRNEQIQEHFGDGRRWNVEIRYSVESQPLGTAGAIKQAEPLVTGTFLVLNGDTFFELNLPELIQSHQSYRKQDAACVGTLALTHVADSSQYGSVVVAENGTIQGFREKVPGVAPERLINAGVYVFEPRLLAMIPGATPVSLERDIFPRIPELGFKLCAHGTDGFFVDIGTPEGYIRFQEYAEGILP